MIRYYLFYFEKMATELGKIEELELELANLKKERSQVENRLKEFEQKEKLFQPRTHFRPKRDRELGTSQENPSKRMRSSTQTVRDEKEDKVRFISLLVWIKILVFSLAKNHFCNCKYKWN